MRRCAARKENPAVVDELRARGFVDENNERAMAGLFVLRRAMHRQQADALARIGLAA
jgi:hypothetical protein